MQTLLDKINMAQWRYNKDTDVYWQTGIVYCENPIDEKWETLGIYVPGMYMNGTENGDGTYTCELNMTGSVGDYTAQTAPIVIPVHTPGYAAMAAPTGYDSNTSSYTNAGFVYVYAGCRGREAGAPAGVTDLKAAIRYIRYVGAVIPGCKERIFSFGMSGGGAQSALLGATGDSDLYMPYLKTIGAVSGVSDAVAGSMCWCPVTSLDYASEAYEWNLGVTRTGLPEDAQELSDKMAEKFALYINELGLTDEAGNVLNLTVSDQGIYQAGSYYEYLKTTIETSLNHFLEDTVFPYTVERGRKGGFHGRMHAHHERDGMDRREIADGDHKTETYETVQDYILALNANTTWVIYDKVSNTAAITSVADFVSARKRAWKNLGAFDALDKSQVENVLFGDGEGKGQHFDLAMAELLADSKYGADYEVDLQKTDAQGMSVTERVNMYNPMYYLDDYYKGYRTTNVAPNWRIRTGIDQGDTALTTEVNLALALRNYGVCVDFETVWEQAHVEAERTGSSAENFIAWVKACCCS